MNNMKELEIEYFKDGVISVPSEIKINVDGTIIEEPNEWTLIHNGWEPYNPFKHDIEYVKPTVINNLLNYDKSQEVNSFYIGDTLAWIDRNTRVSLMNSTLILKNSGIETTTLWLNNTSFTINCDLLIQMLGALEIYALQCYNITEQHKSNINKLETIEEINNYDYTKNYPEKLIFTL